MKAPKFRPHHRWICGGLGPRLCPVSGLLPDDAVGMPGAAQGGVVGDQALAVEVVEAVVHQDHAFLAPSLDGVFQLVELVFADEIAHGAVGDDEFVGQHAAGAVGGGQEVLGDDALQGVGQLEDDLALGAAFEDADDAFQGMGDVGRMHGGQNEVTGFGRGQRGGDGLVIAHFADDDDVGVLAQDVDEGAVEGADVGEHFLLDDDGALVFVDELDGVLDGDDLAAALAVDEVHQVIEGGGFAGAGGAGDEDQAVGSAGQLVDFLGQAEFLAGGDACRRKSGSSFPDGRCGGRRWRARGRRRCAAGKCTAPIPGRISCFCCSLSRLSAISRDLLLGQGVLVGNDDFAVDAEGGRHAGDQVEVGGVEFVGGGEEPVQVFSCSLVEDSRLATSRAAAKRQRPAWESSIEGAAGFAGTGG